MPDIIGTKGAELDILIRQGTTFGPNSMQLRDATGVVINLTGATFRGQIRKTPDAPYVQSSLVFTITDAPNGMVTFELPAASSKEMFAANTGEESADSQYVWDCEVTLSSGKVLPLLFGTVKLFREVTKE
jgi:hypothetical protein